MKKIWIYVNFICGVLALWIFIDHITGFTPHDYFYVQNPNLSFYSGVNVVSRWADLSFFTYHSMIFYGIWAIGLFLAELLKSEKLSSFFKHNSVVTFVLTNYILTMIVYTAFEFASGNPTFGLYDKTAKAIHNFVTNVLGHFILPIIAIICGFKVEQIGKIKTWHLLAIFAYLITYCIVVKITGMYCYQIEWYPYPIFHADLLCKMLGINGANAFIKTLVVITAFTVLACAYLSIFYLVKKIKNALKTKIKTI